MKPTRQTINPLLAHTAPRHHLFTRFATAQTQTPLIHRPFHNTPRTQKDFKPAANPSSFTQFSRGPSPPQLPPEEQAIFESLQRQSTGAFSTPRSPPKINQSPDSSSSEVSAAEAETTKRAEKLADAGTQRDSETLKEFQARIKAQGDGEELHPNVRRGARPEFEGDKNPKTGEVGGPKNEPLRWGASGEWSYNGRTTDF